MPKPTDYQAVIGLEIHAQLRTKSKMFASEACSYGALPNTQTSPVTLAYPGAMPTLNGEAVDHAIRMGLATGCTIRDVITFARKQYFYPDLPKGYQISQDKDPICTGGQLTISTAMGKKVVRIQRIHLEEDTGKALHSLMPGKSLLDYNRAGTPLIEIVTEPDLASGEEAYAFLTAIRRLVRYLAICDGNMEEGSLRCDANISVMLRGSKVWGERVEVKNMNSIRHVQLAIAYETVRQVELIERGQQVRLETRSYQATTNTTHHMRYKETMSDYRYFPEPDLSPVCDLKARSQELAVQMPLLPDALHEKFTTAYSLSTYDADVLTDQREVALFFEAICGHTSHYKLAANWVTGPVKALLNRQKRTMVTFPVGATAMAKLVTLTAEGGVSFSAAVQRLFPLLVAGPDKDPKVLAKELGLMTTSDAEVLEGWVTAVLEAYPEKVKAYQLGKRGLLGFFMGEIMRRSQGKAAPAATQAALRARLQLAP